MIIANLSAAEIALERYYKKYKGIELSGDQYEEYARNLIEHVLRVERVSVSLRRNTAVEDRLSHDLSTLHMLCMWIPPKENLRIAKEALNKNKSGDIEGANNLLEEYIKNTEDSIHQTAVDLGNIDKRKHPLNKVVEEIYAQNPKIMGKQLEDEIKEKKWHKELKVVGNTIYPVDRRFPTRSIGGLPSLLSRISTKSNN